MNRFVISRNIQRFHELIKRETEEAHRRVLGDLLAEEEARLADLDRSQNALPTRRGGDEQSH